MSTRNELSERNEYWIERHRYLELLHFCLQYPIWKKARSAIEASSVDTVKMVLAGRSKTKSDPVAKRAEALMFYSNRMEMVEKAAKMADKSLSEYLLKGVTERIPYDILKISHGIPCCRDVYYENYHKFFYILNKLRK